MAVGQGIPHTIHEQGFINQELLTNQIFWHAPKSITAILLITL